MTERGVRQTTQFVSQLPLSAWSVGLVVVPQSLVLPIVHEDHARTALVQAFGDELVRKWTSSHEARALYGLVYNPLAAISHRLMSSSSATQIDSSLASNGAINIEHVATLDTQLLPLISIPPVDDDHRTPAAALSSVTQSAIQAHQRRRLLQLSSSSSVSSQQHELWLGSMLFDLIQWSESLLDLRFPFSQLSICWMSNCSFDYVLMGKSVVHAFWGAFSASHVTTFFPPL